MLDHQTEAKVTRWSQANSSHNKTIKTEYTFLLLACQTGLY